MIIGLTGRAGTGKTTAAAAIAKELDLKIIDLDKIGHKLLNNSHIKAELLAKFSPKILNQDQTINRDILSSIVFSSQSLLNDLNQIIHPKIKKEVLNTIKKHQDHHILIVGALIKEIGLTPLCRKIITIDADEKKIRQYLGEKSIILNFQRSQKEYQKEAAIVIQNNFDETFIQSCLETTAMLIE
ncbi:dephospho-CoA kinase [Candidatus Margulisiibacteriota bacterium]